MNIKVNVTLLEERYETSDFFLQTVKVKIKKEIRYTKYFAVIYYKVISWHCARREICA